MSAPAGDYRHTGRLIVIVVLLIGTAAVVRWLAIPESFGWYGRYRGAAAAEARAASEPRHIGQETCAECHDEKVELHDKDAHARVPCETCHGPGAEHAESDGDAPMRKPEGKEACLVCHQRLAARPGAFPQIEWREHYDFVGVADEAIDCTRCHDPHEPLFMDRDLRTARLHPTIHRCRDCHQGRDDESLKRPAGHPPIFECSYCHEAIAEDFAKRSHAGVRCTTCHIFFRETESAGRIIRDADPRFCLLCHGDADFRNGDAPGVDWPGHREELGTMPEDQHARCIDCHRENIHAPEVTP